MSAGPVPAVGTSAVSPARTSFGVFARLGELLALIFAGRPGVFLGFGSLVLVVPAALVAAVQFGVDMMRKIDAESNVTAPWIIALALAVVVFGLGALVCDLTGWLWTGLIERISRDRRSWV